MADNFRYAQLQTFYLAGAGAIIGATSITLKSMKDIDGASLSMSGTFGTIGYGTLEPGVANEEQISFTGLTNNANGTVTLTGVKTVSFVYPYTETSGLAKTHAGSTSFIISNTSGFYDKFANKNDTETINEVWTYASGATPLITDTPTTGLQAVNKDYVDNTFGDKQDAIQFKNEGVNLGTSGTVTSIDFTGAGVTATRSTNALTVNIPNTGGGTGGDLTWKSGIATKNIADASTTQTIAHGLGTTPTVVRFSAANNPTGGLTFMTGVYDGTNNNFIGGSRFSSADLAYSDDILSIGLTDTNDEPWDAGQTGVVTVDATNITITWTKHGSISGTQSFMWEAGAGSGGGTGGGVVKGAALTTTNTYGVGTNVVEFDGETYDTTNFHSNVTNPSRITIPSTSKYLITGGTQATVGSGTRQLALELLLNGTTVIQKSGQVQMTSSVGAGANISYIGEFTTGDYLELQVTVITDGGTVAAGTNFAITEITGGGGIGGTKLYIDTTPVTATVGTTAMFTKSIPGGTLGINNGIHWRAYVSDIDCTADNVTVNIRYGGTTIATTGGMTAGGNNGTGVLEGYIYGNGATNAQVGDILFTAVINGVTRNIADDGTAAVDSTADQDLVLQAVCATAGDAITITSFDVELVSSVGVATNVVQSVTDDNDVVVIDNSDPENPVVQFAGVHTDGVTITGDGTVGDPLVSSSGTPTYQLVESKTISAVSTTTSTQTTLASFTGLDGDTDGNYMIEWAIDDSTQIGAAPYIGLTFNATAGSSYQFVSRVQVLSTGSATNTVDSGAAVIKLVDTNMDDPNFGVIRIYTRPSTTDYKLVQATTNSATSYSETQGVWTSGANITSIQLVYFQNSGSTGAVSGVATLYKINR